MIMNDQPEDFNLSESVQYSQMAAGAQHSKMLKLLMAWFLKAVTEPAVTDSSGSELVLIANDFLKMSVFAKKSLFLSRPSLEGVVLGKMPKSLR